MWQFSLSLSDPPSVIKSLQDKLEASSLPSKKTHQAAGPRRPMALHAYTPPSAEVQSFKDNFCVQVSLSDDVRGFGLFEGAFSLAGWGSGM